MWHSIDVYCMTQDVTMTDSNEKYLSDRQVAERYSISRHTAWRWTREGALPTPVKIRQSDGDFLIYCGSAKSVRLPLVLSKHLQPQIKLARASGPLGVSQRWLANKRWRKKGSLYIKLSHNFRYWRETLHFLFTECDRGPEAWAW